MSFTLCEKELFSLYTIAFSWEVLRFFFFLLHVLNQKLSLKCKNLSHLQRWAARGTPQIHVNLKKTKNIRHLIFFFINTSSCSLLIEPWATQLPGLLQKAHLQWKIIKFPQPDVNKRAPRCICFILKNALLFLFLNFFYPSSVEGRKSDTVTWCKVKAEKCLGLTSCPSILLFIQEILSAMVCLCCQTFISLLLVKMSCSQTISSSMVLPFQDIQSVCHVMPSHLRISAPECPPCVWPPCEWCHIDFSYRVSGPLATERCYPYSTSKLRFNILTF